MRHTVAVLRAKYTVSQERFTFVCLLAVVGLTAIIFTGAAVRLTGSGLGCPTWPKCTQDSLYTELSTHGVIEFGNRLLTFVVGFAAVAPLVLIWFRRPFRRDLAFLSVLLPLGVVAQAVLGGISVKTGLAPGYVMGHYALSALILVAAIGLWWRSKEEPWLDPPGADRPTILLVRALLVVGVLSIALGTASTAAGPHAGGSGTQDVVARLTWDGPNTLSLLVHLHSYVNGLLGALVLAAWWLARTRGAVPELQTVLTRLALLMAAQGVLGILQYQLELPAELVWAHVVMATLTWIGLVRAWALAGPLDGRPVGGAEPVETRLRVGVNA